MKQKTAIRQLIEILEVRIRRYAEFDNGEIDVSSTLALQDAKKLLRKEKKMLIEAYYDGDEDCINQNKTTGKQYFEKKYES